MFPYTSCNSSCEILHCLNMRKVPLRDIGQKSAIHTDTIVDLSLSPKERQTNFQSNKILKNSFAAYNLKRFSMTKATQIKTPKIVLSLLLKLQSYILNPVFITLITQADQLSPPTAAQQN